MARRKQQGTQRGAGANADRSYSLEDALSATQQHTVPVLPAGNASSTRKTLAQVTAQTRVTLAPRPMPAYPAPDDTAAEEDGDSQALAPGRPTFHLPALTDAQLPALRPDDEDYQVATYSEPEAPAVFIRGAAKPPRPYLHIVPRRTGRRSFIAQFVVAMITVMTLLTAATLATPLGQSVAFASTFQSYANAVPWKPTPTPTPRPKPAYSPPPGANPGQQAVINEIVAVFGSYAQGAINVARCESGFDPNARNPYPIGNSHAEGVFQILYPSTWDTTSYAADSPYNYVDNIHAAYQIFSRDGHTWREWACQP